jgi:DNA ligase (NAD+)
MDKPTRIRELSDLIKTHRDAYYNPEAPLPPNFKVVPDDVYDAWVDELSELVADNDAVTAIGAVPTGSWPKVNHPVPMGSLNKVNTEEEMKGWVQDVSRATVRYEPLLVSEKLDGISLRLHYEKGKLTQAATRGDGTVGEDITPNVLKMQGVLLKVPERFTGEIRGEIILFRDDLKEYFPDKANTRNTASGVSKRLDGVGCEHLHVLVYKIVEGLDLKSESEVFEKLITWGFKTPNWYLTAMTPGIKTPQDLWSEYQQGRRDSLPYDIDGLVVAVNDVAHQLGLGESDMRPKGAVAYKFQPVTRESTLRQIEWQVGNTGRITPVAIFDAVNLLGTTVTNASLYNYAYIEKLKLDIGAKILVARANDVIPRVVLVLQETGTIAQPPARCPVCGAELTRMGKYIVCPNKSACPAQAEGRIKQWIAEQGILEWGGTLVKKVVTSGLVKSVPDLYRLTHAQLSGLERMGSRSAEVALTNLDPSREVPLERFLGGLAIPNCATSTVRLIMDAGFDTLDKIQGMSVNDLMKIDGIGQVKAESLFYWLKANKALLDDLQTVVKLKAKILGSFTGKSVCFTGTMVHKRAELEAMVVNAGGVVKGNVGKGLSFLVIADPNSTTSKAVAARKNGTRCISEEEFLAMVKP